MEVTPNVDAIHGAPPNLDTQLPASGTLGYQHRRLDVDLCESGCEEQLRTCRSETGVIVQGVNQRRQPFGFDERIVVDQRHVTDLIKISEGKVVGRESRIANLRANLDTRVGFTKPLDAPVG